MTSYPIKLFYKSHGNGPPIIILHGLLGSSSNWSTTADLLGKHLQVFAVDLRNHGNSPHARDFDFNSMVADLKIFMENQNMRQAIILGHSLGGRVAMEFADQYPAMVDKLIIVDVAPKSYPPTHKAMLDVLLAIDLNTYETAKDVVDALAKAIPSLQLRNFLAKNIYRMPDGLLGWKVNLRAIRDNYDSLCVSTDFKNSYEKPVLFIRGELSDYICAEDEPVIRKIYPQSKIKTIAGAGHWVHIDSKNSFLYTVLNFAA